LEQKAINKQNEYNTWQKHGPKELNDHNGVEKIKSGIARKSRHVPKKLKSEKKKYIKLAVGKGHKKDKPDE